MRNIPYPLLQAIKNALTYLSWEEHLDRDERPPRAMWTDSELVGAHFDALNRKRKDRVDGRGIDNPMQNDAARMLIVG